ncbi:MAG: DMT family transporter [Deltaproteobacteria bacterium]|nr:DMT family transporter [Deltaproteobacteria bacterium]
MPLPHAGEIAALATAFFWAASAVSFEYAGRRIGSLSLNLLRLVQGFVLLAAVVLVASGPAAFTSISGEKALLLSISGLVGLVFGDYCLFRAMVVMGARTALLVMSLVPLLTVGAGWVVLHEGPDRLGVVGMLLTVLGVAWVVLERNPQGEARYPLSGILLALGGAVGQAAGLLLSRPAMEGTDPFVAATWRVVSGLAGYIVLLTLTGWWPRFRTALRDGRTVRISGIGAFFGPFLGITGSMAAVRYTDAGTAATIMALVPVILIPSAALLFHERVTLRAVAGAILAVGGVTLLFL